MRYSIFILLAALILSCSSAVHPAIPKVEVPDLPNNQSIVVEGVAGSSAEPRPHFSYIINPTILKKGNDVSYIEDSKIEIIVPDSLFEKWKQAHTLLVYASLEQNESNWFLIGLRSLGYRP